ANKAYMLIRSGNVPDALWKDDSSFAREYIAIEGISDIEDYVEPSRAADTRTYNLKGQVVNGSGSLPPGIYIRNGRKFVVN
ncbi:MAG: hypothetical protein IJT19_07090, partial [Bacteroidaceae bacterium]|nr:hypothetical protein [Bacteroidaceae bacterium]